MTYEQLKKSYAKKKVADDLDTLDFELDREEVVNLIEDHFSPEEIQDDDYLTEEAETETEVESDESEMETDETPKLKLEKFFAQVENNEDSRKANSRQVEQKKLFLPMKKHFEAHLVKLNKKFPGQKAQEMVNTWIQNKKKPSDLKKIFENNILKGKAEMIKKFARICEKFQNPIPFAKLLAQWTTDFFLKNMDVVQFNQNSLQHNDFRKKKLLRLQVELITRHSFGELQHFYEILHKFHLKDESAPQTAQKYVEAWILSGFSFRDVTGLFVSAVHIPSLFDQLSVQLMNIFDKASCFFPKDVDPKILLEYTAMYFFAKIKLSKGRNDLKNEAEHWSKIKENVVNMQHQEEDYNELEKMIRKKYKISDLWKIMQDISTMTGNQPIHKSAFRAALQANLLKEHCDKPQHRILKDFLVALEMMKIVDEEDENESKMDDESMVEEGECLTTDYESDASAFSTASNASAKKKKAILVIPNVELDDDLKAEVIEAPEEFDLKNLETYDYYLDTHYLWVRPDMRMDLRMIICKNYTLEAVLRYWELMGKVDQSHAEYVKELTKLYPNLEVIEESDVPEIMRLLEKVQAGKMDRQNCLRAYRKTFIALSAIR